MQPQTGVSLQTMNTLRLRSEAAALCTVDSPQAVRSALDWGRAQGLPAIALGEGSNVVLPGNWHALVLLQRSRGIEVLEQTADKVRLRVAAGENWHGFVAWTLQQGFYGLENLALIPGTVGAAPIQNIGAYGIELAAFTERVHAIAMDDGSDVELSGEECRFSYRDSIFKHELRQRLLITAVDFRLSRHPQVQTAYPALGNYLAESGLADPTPQQVFDSVVAIRSSKLPDPAVEPNAGSFFKNPVVSAEFAATLRERFPALPAYPQDDGSVKLAAGWLIEHCGWKGYREAGVGVHADHALVLINCGADCAEGLLHLAGRIADDVASTFGITLVIEPSVFE